MSDEATITRPSDDTCSGRVWTIADRLSKLHGRPATRKEVVEVSVQNGLAPSTATSQYGRWAKFNGVPTMRRAKFASLPPLVIPGE